MLIIATSIHPVRRRCECEHTDVETGRREKGSGKTHASGDRRSQRSSPGLSGEDPHRCVDNARADPGSERPTSTGSFPGRPGL